MTYCDFDGRGFCTEVENERVWCVANTYEGWLYKIESAAKIPGAKIVRDEEFSRTIEYTWNDGSKTHEIYTFIEV